MLCNFHATHNHSYIISLCSMLGRFFGNSPPAAMMLIYMYSVLSLCLLFVHVCFANECFENSLTIRSFDIMEPRHGSVINSTHLLVKLGYHVDDGEQFSAHKHKLQICLFYGGRKKCFADIFRDHSVLISTPPGNLFDVSAILCAARDANYCFCSSMSTITVMQSVQVKAKNTPLCMCDNDHQYIKGNQEQQTAVSLSLPVLKVMLLLDGTVGFESFSAGVEEEWQQLSLWQSLQSIVTAANTALAAAATATAAGNSGDGMGAVSRVSYTVVVCHSASSSSSSQKGTAEAIEADLQARAANMRALVYRIRDFVQRQHAIAAASALDTSTLEVKVEVPDVSLYACAPHQAHSLLQCAMFSVLAESQGQSYDQDQGQGQGQISSEAVVVFMPLYVSVPGGTAEAAAASSSSKNSNLSAPPPPSSSPPPINVRVKSSAFVELVDVLQGQRQRQGSMTTACERIGPAPPCVALAVGTGTGTGTVSKQRANTDGSLPLTLTERFLSMSSTRSTTAASITTHTHINGRFTHWLPIDASDIMTAYSSTSNSGADVGFGFGSTGFGVRRDALVHFIHEWFDDEQEDSGGDNNMGGLNFTKMARESVSVVAAYPPLFL